MFKLKVIIWILVLSTILGVAVFFAFKQSERIHRNPTVLLNKYYILKKNNPLEAQVALIVILDQDKNNVSALKELSQWYIKNKQPDKSLPLLQRLHALVPENNNYTLQLAYLYYREGQWSHATFLFSSLRDKGS